MAQGAIFAPLRAIWTLKNPPTFTSVGSYCIWLIQGGLLVDYLRNTRDS